MLNFKLCPVIEVDVDRELGVSLRHAKYYIPTTSSYGAHNSTKSICITRSIKDMAAGTAG